MHYGFQSTLCYTDWVFLRKYHIRKIYVILNVNFHLSLELLRMMKFATST